MRRNVGSSADATIAPIAIATHTANPRSIASQSSAMVGSNTATRLALDGLWEHRDAGASWGDGGVLHVDRPRAGGGAGVGGG